MVIHRHLPGIALILAACQMSSPTFADVTIRNTSSQAIQEGKLVVFQREYRFEHLSPGESLTVSFTTAGGGSYRIALTFASGRALSSNSLGYVGEGIPARDTIVIGDDSITIANGLRPESEPPLPLTPFADLLHPSPSAPTPAGA